MSKILLDYKCLFCGGDLFLTECIIGREGAVERGKRFCLVVDEMDRFPNYECSIFCHTICSKTGIDIYPNGSCEEVRKLHKKTLENFPKILTNGFQMA